MYGCPLYHFTLLEFVPDQQIAKASAFMEMLHLLMISECIASGAPGCYFTLLIPMEAIRVHLGFLFTGLQRVL